MTGRPTTDTLDATTRARFVVDSGWFDAGWYCAQRPDAAAASDPLEHWLSVGSRDGLAPGPLLAASQDQRLGRADVTGIEDEPPDPDDPQVLRDVALLAATGLFDEDYYRTQTADRDDLGALDGEEPLAHFCRVGWRVLLRPQRGFDVWWYWSTYLDPAAETINPFVHWIVQGRAAGLDGRPPTPATSGGWRRPVDRPMRRVCLFAGFDVQGRIDETAVDYVRELSRFADVYYLADCYLPDSELAKLDGITRGAWAIRHGCYDFGSYSMLAHDLVGWETVQSYDELLLVNDSCYVVRPFDEVFATMDERACDWWGLQATKGLAATAEAPSNRFTAPLPLEEVQRDLLAAWEDDDVYDFHVGSYFLAYRRPVLDDAHFRRLVESVHRQRTKAAIIHKYEIGLTHTLLASGHAFDTFLDAVYPFHPLFTEWYFELLERGFPLLKKYFLYQNHYDVPGLADWQDRVRAVVPDARLDPMARHLHRSAPDDRLRRSFAIRRDPDGTVTVPETLTGRRFRQADEETPTDDTWWAFAVSAEDHALPANSRAILEQVRHDPAITKVLLTRTRTVDVPGENVLVLPIASPEGQRALMRSRHVFVQGQPRWTLGGRLEAGHRIVVVRDGLGLGLRRTVPPRRVEQVPETRWHAALAASEVDRLAVLASNYPGEFSQVWRTGIPAHDFLVNPAELLPAELVADEARLRAELDGRPLLLLAAARRGRERTPYAFTQPEVDWLADWSARTGVAIGVREHPHDLDRTYAARLPFALDLSPVRFPVQHAVLRVADAVLTDYADAAFDVRAATGRPVVSFAHDLEQVSPTHALEHLHLFPGPVCRDFDRLTAALDGLFDPPSAEDARDQERRARLLAGPVTGDSAARVVELVRRDVGAGAVA